ncbi:MAG: hypothetical protein AAF389_02535 [Gemmatimonadota bacterium]
MTSGDGRGSSGAGGSIRRAYFVLLSVLLLIPPSSATGQARASDTVSPEALVTAAYEAIGREPGQPYDWDRFHALFHEQARLIPNVQQTGGTLTVMTPAGFAAWADGNTVVGGANDRGFYEEEIHHEVDRFGAMAQVFSTYQKRFADTEVILGTGINSFQMIHSEDRWWIVSIIWDEERAGLSIPGAYRGGGSDG